MLITLSITAFSKQITETISVMYDNIKIIIDGKEYIATDANGDVVEPFIYNGTTYLPVRAIANAFDKDVEWEPQTSTVVLGSKNYDWLDQLGYANYETNSQKNSLTAWESGTRATDEKKYDRGMKILLSHYTEENDDGIYESYQNIEYLLNGNYNSFKGKLACIQGNQSVIVKIYGDGNLLYTSPLLSDGTKTVDFDIDVSKYKILKINASIPNLKHYSGSSIIGIVDARLEKK